MVVSVEVHHRVELSRVASLLAELPTSGGVFWKKLSLLPQGESGFLRHRLGDGECVACDVEHGCFRG